MLLENNPYPQDVRVRSEAVSLVGAGHEVTVIAPRAAGQRRRELVGGVRVRRFDLPEGSTPAGIVLEYAIANFWLHLLGFAELVRGAQVLHLHNPPDTLFGLGFLARLLGREVVFDHHDLAPELFEAKFGNGRAARLLRGFERLTFRSASLVLAANQSHSEVALERGKVPAERIAIVRNGPPPGAFREVSRGRGGDLEDPRLLFLGSMESQDGVDDLPALMKVLADHHGLTGASLTCVGEGSRRPALEAAFAATGSAHRVRFTGRVPHAEVPALLAAADICIDPAPCTPLNHRSTMIKIAEYMAAARPVVAFPLLETRRTADEAIAYAECGNLASFAARVAELARRPEQRSELAGLAANRARTLGWAESEKVLVEAYAELSKG